MKSQLIRAVALLPAVLLACGGDDAPKLTGMFVDSAVSGLRYKSKSASGLTNAAGEFKYNQGEQVTFSVGGIVIGTVVGAARVTPFDLFGVTPPTTAMAFNAELDAGDEVTGLEQALNVAQFLIGLDADDNPDNGIDLASADTVLKNASLDFNQEPARFAYEHLIPLFVAHEIGNIRAFGSATGSHLFASVGATVAASAVATISEDAGADGSAEFAITNTYNARGQRTLNVQSNLAGIVTRRTSNQYDDSGRLVTTTIEYDSAGGGLFHNQQVMTQAFGEDGFAATATTDYGTDGVVYLHRLVTYTRNSFGSVTVERTDDDDDVDGQFDSSQIVTTAYDAHNRVTKVTGVLYSDLGVTPFQIEETTRAYDDAGNEVEHIYDRDDGADGGSNERTVTTRTFDGTRETSVRVDSEDAAHALLQRELTTTTYDADGRVDEVVVQSDVDGDGFYEYIETITRERDPSGNVLRESSDGVNGGMIHNLTLTEYVYDAAGNMTTKKVTTNQNSQANPAPDRIVLETYTYDGSSNQLVYERSVDANADLTFDETTRTTRTYTSIADGVRFLLNSLYLPR